MRVMSIDAEYNQPSKRLIQVAAVVFDVESAELLESFEAYVNPREPISDHIKELTGISYLDVCNAPDFQLTFSKLKEIHKKYKCFKNPLVWGSGETNDSFKIYDHMYPTQELKDANPNFMGYRVIDVKSIYQSIQIYNNKSFSGSLEDVCRKLKIGFEGDPHRALPDAINTFRVWKALVEKFPGGFK
jgi:inhibitor of KinA sporulation pathway (predicted exonuclease)